MSSVQVGLLSTLLHGQRQESISASSDGIGRGRSPSFLWVFSPEGLEGVCVFLWVFSGFVFLGWGDVCCMTWDDQGLVPAGSLPPSRVVSNTQ